MVKSTSEDPTEKITKVTPLGAGSVDRKNAGLLMLAPRSGQSDSKKASKGRWPGSVDTYTQALNPQKRAAQSKVVGMIRPKPSCTVVVPRVSGEIPVTH